MLKLAIVGSMSNVGKTFISTALIRSISKLGISVTAFKGQNMSLNSYVSIEGKEIARSQTVQSYAAYKDVSIISNPILLKPGYKTFQVIHNGEVILESTFQEYLNLKNQYLYNAIKNQFNSIQDEMIIIEGAGSISEINLHRYDIANMLFIKDLNIPYLLIVDINLGGVFAQIYGTLSLIDKKSRNNCVGIIINKFRGDINILKKGIKQIEKLSNKKVLGVLPYIDENSYIDSEDSLNIRNLNINNDNNRINIAVVKVPYISNFTDFDILQLENDISLTYINSFKRLDIYDLIILPGTRATVHTLYWLLKLNFDIYIEEYLTDKNKKLLGICGGYQILGKEIIDSIESDRLNKKHVGLSLLPISTIFQKKKTVRRISEFYRDYKISAYEIHYGISKIESNDANNYSLFPGGIMNENIYGTSYHGLFDNDEFRSYFFNLKSNVSLEGLREQQINNSADILNNCINIRSLLREITGRC